MKALTVIHYPMFGGPHNRVLRLNRGLRARDWETIALLPDEPGNAAGRLETGGVRVVQIRLHRFRASKDPAVQLAFALNLAADVRRIRREIRAASADVVVVGGLVNPHGAIAARLEGVPVVWQIVDSRTPRPLRLACMPLVNRLADAIMFGGRALADLHLPGGLSRMPSFVCSPPVDLDRFVPSTERRSRVRDHLGFPPDAPVVGTVSNLTPAKGVEYFIRAAGRIYRADPRARFMVVGARYDSHRRYTAALEAELVRTGIPVDQFCFVGERDDVENWYPAMDVTLITSVPRSEGTTTTAMEAMACGIPVVATDVGAVSEVVEHGVTGLIVPPLDDAALAARTVPLLRDPALRSRLGKAGRGRATRFDVESRCDRYVEVFDAALARRRRQRRLPPSPVAAEPGSLLSRPS